jgi:hypothetical protein
MDAVSPEAPAPTLHVFPGMPALTYRVLRRLRRNCEDSRLVLVLDEPRPHQRAPDEGYSVYVGVELVGRYTIRKCARCVERNFLCILPETSAIPRCAIEEGAFGVAAPEWIDRLRARLETLEVFVNVALDLLWPIPIQSLSGRFRAGGGSK